MRKIDDLRRQRKKQLCNPSEFRRLVCGGDSKFPSLIQKNTKPYGIPQGTPISDVVANFYLLDFDSEVNDFIKSRGGFYRRYCDDIICIVSKNSTTNPLEVKEFLQERIPQYGQNLVIQDRKVVVGEFVLGADGLEYAPLFPAGSKKQEIEYLGFAFNGEAVRIKDGTLSNAWRKLKRYAYGHARLYVRQYRQKGAAWLRKNYPRDWVVMKLLRDVTHNQDEGYESWTFVKYTRRASSVFRDFPTRFSAQTRRYRYLTDRVVEQCLEKAISRHS